MRRFMKGLIQAGLVAGLGVIMAGCVPGTLPYSAAGVLGWDTSTCTSTFDGTSGCVGVVDVSLNAGDRVHMDVTCSNPQGGMSFEFGVEGSSNPPEVIGFGCGLDQSYIFTAPAAGTYGFGVYNDNATLGDSADVSISVYIPGQKLGDGRINDIGGATFAVYCKGAIIEVYGINGGTGLGYFAFRASQTSEIPDTNTLLKKFENITLWRLAGSGLYQINRGPDAEGKTYVFRFDGCPATEMENEFLN